MSILDKRCTENAEAFFPCVLYKMFVRRCREILVVLLNQKSAAEGKDRLNEVS